LLSFALQVDAHSNLGNLMKAQGLVQEVSPNIGYYLNSVLEF